MLCDSCDLVPKLRSSSIILEPKQCKLTGSLTLNPTSLKTLAGLPIPLSRVRISPAFET